jgi:thioesterase domain-containing protein
MADGGSEPPIYVVYAGSHQFRIARFFGGKRPVFGIDVPLRSAWCAAAADKWRLDLPTMQQLVEPYLNALKAHAGSRPCILLGHCFAGLIAFELAHRFLQIGGSVEKVILLDSSPVVLGPIRVAMRQILEHWTNVPERSLAGRASALSGRLTQTGRTLLWLLSQYARHGWWDLKKRIIGLPPATVTGMRDENGNFITFPTLMQIYDKIYDTHVPRPLGTSGILVKAEPFNDNERPYRNFDPALGWGGLFMDGLKIIEAKGNHISIVENDENLAAIAREVNALLERDLVGGTVPAAKADRDREELLIGS